MAYSSTSLETELQLAACILQLLRLIFVHLFGRQIKAGSWLVDSGPWFGDERQV